MKFFAAQDGSIINGDCIDSMQLAAAGNYGGSLYRLVINTTGGQKIQFSEEKNKEEAGAICGVIMNILLSGQDGIFEYPEIKARSMQMM